jgi:hypothetical protein
MLDAYFSRLPASEQAKMAFGACHHDEPSPMADAVSFGSVC